MSAFEVREDDLTSGLVLDLVRHHLKVAAEDTPPESVHALGVEELRSPAVTFFSVWSGTDLMGIAALQELDPRHGEVKSMHTAAAHRRKGVAAVALEHILVMARQRGYRQVSLETGSSDAFAAARKLYAGYGFKPCAPFADYVEDPLSTFMTLQLE